MSTAWSPPRTAEELPDDDHEAIYRITGGLYDGLEIDRRKRKLWPTRNCPPSVKRDPEMTEKFRKAVTEHDRHLMDIEARIKSGELKLEEVTDEFIISGLAKLALDGRRQGAQLSALKALAEIRGLLKNSERASVDDDTLEQLLEDARERRRSAGPRSTKSTG